MHERDIDTTTSGPNSGTASSATETAKQAGETAKQGAKQVAGTAKEQGRQVVGEVGTQARSVVSDVRQSVAGQARTGHDKLTESLRRIADDLGNMGGDTSSPAGQIVSRLADTGRRAADHLQDRGPEGLLDDVQEFARRKPGTFLIAAAAAGFVIGRLGRSTVSAARSDSDSSGGYDSTAAYGTTATYASGGYTASGNYGTGAPTTGLVDDPYAAPGTSVYDTPATTTGGSAVGTAAVDPLSYPVDPVGVPSERGTAR